MPCAGGDAAAAPAVCGRGAGAVPGAHQRVPAAAAAAAAGRRSRARRVAGAPVHSHGPASLPAGGRRPAPATGAHFYFLDFFPFPGMGFGYGDTAAGRRGHARRVARLPVHSHGPAPLPARLCRAAAAAGVFFFFCSSGFQIIGLGSFILKPWKTEHSFNLCLQELMRFRNRDRQGQNALGHN